MHADLERLIRLQTLDHEIQALRQLIDSEPERRRAVDAAVESRRNLVAAERERLTLNQHQRRELEKELAQVQGRLSRYKDQLMAVKTNKEYQAMQHEIVTAEADVRRFEDQVLEQMIAGDELAAGVKAHEADLRQVEADAVGQIRALGEESGRAHRRIEEATGARARLAAELPRALLETYDALLSRRGSAVVEVRDGHCSVCHVRLRPKTDQDVRRNESILHCDSCQRFLYYVVRQASPSAPAPPQNA